MKMDLLPYNNENLLANFPCVLRKNFKELFANGNIGLTPITLNDVIPTRQYMANNSSYGYQYTIRIPYAGKRLSWELIFDPDDTKFVPDFNFNDANFYAICDVDTLVEDVPSLINWDVGNPKALMSLLKEFLDLYKKQQLKKLQQDNIYAQLNSEYQVLIEEIPLNDVEISLENTVAHFLIRIKVDTSDLPEYLQPTKDENIDTLLNPGDDVCLLKISYLKLDGSQINTSLQLSPRLDKIFGLAKKLEIPDYSRTSLADYVNLITKTLQDYIKKIKEHHLYKKAYISWLYALYGESIIEFDSETFSKCILLWEVEGYHCLVSIEISALFPEEKPIITLQSLYCITSSKKLCSEKIDSDCLHNTKWEPMTAAKQLAEHLQEFISKFKTHKH